MRPITGFFSRVTSTCGLGLIGNFSFGNRQWATKLKDINLVNNGIGYTVAGFVDTKVCEKMYKHVAEKYKIVFQSPVKINRNSGRKFFFIIFTKKD